jgi:hypothetical protein
MTAGTGAADCATTDTTRTRQVRRHAPDVRYSGTTTMTSTAPRRGCRNSCQRLGPSEWAEWRLGWRLGRGRSGEGKRGVVPAAPGPGATAAVGAAASERASAGSGAASAAPVARRAGETRCSAHGAAGSRGWCAGMVTAGWGVRGGAGVTTVAVALAVLASRGDRGVLPVDLAQRVTTAGHLIAQRAHRAALVTRACRLSMRRLATAPVRCTEVIVVREAGRRVSRFEIEAAAGIPVFADLPDDPAVADAVDEGTLGLGLPASLTLALWGHPHRPAVTGTAAP